MNNQSYLIQIDVTLANMNDFERIVEGSWDNKVQDFCVRSTTRQRLRQDVYVDLAILSKEGFVFEASLDTVNRKLKPLSQRVPIILFNKTTVPITQLSTYHWLSLIEVETEGKPQTLRKQGGYLVHGYSLAERRNVVLHTDSDSQVVVGDGDSQLIQQSLHT